jgi:hypothetical protein
MAHSRQTEKKDNIRILKALMNSSGANDVQRSLGAEATGKQIGVSRI